MLVANLFPVLAVMNGSMTVAGLLWLFWIENLLVGAAAWVRAVLARADDRTQLHWEFARYFPLVFFPIHFGGFLFVHAIFLWALAQGSLSASGPVKLPALALGVLLGQVVLLGSWIRNGQAAQATTMAELVRPYPRMTGLHVLIIGLTFVIFSYPGPQTALYAALGVCGVKIVVDAAAYRRT